MRSPGRRLRTLAIFLVTLALVWTASLILHEVGHGLTAQLLGGKVIWLRIWPGVEIWPSLGQVAESPWGSAIARLAYTTGRNWTAGGWQVGMVALMGSVTNLLLTALALGSLWLFRPRGWLRLLLVAEALMFADLLLYCALPEFLGLPHYLVFGGSAAEPLDGAELLDCPRWAFVALSALVSGMMAWGLVAYLRLSSNGGGDEMAFQKRLTRLFTKGDRSPGTASFERGLAALDAGDAAATLRAFEQAISLGLGPAELPEAHLGLGEAHLRLNQIEEALAAYRRAVEIDPQNRKAWNNLGSAFWRAGRFEEAIDAHHQALRIDPNDAAAYADLGGVYTAMGQLDRAVEVLETAIQLNPELAFAHSNLAVAHALAARFEQAYASISAANESGYPEVCGLKFQIDMIKTQHLLRGRGRERNWLDLLEEAKPEPDDADITSLRYAYALSDEYDPYYQKNEIEAGVRETRQAAEAEDWQTTIQAATRVLGINYMHMETHWHLVDAYLRTGQETQAVPHQHFLRSCLRSIHQSGLGQSYSTAYVVISQEEETYFLRFQGAMEGVVVQRPRRYLEHEGHRFDLFQVQDGKTGERSEIYFNLDLVFRGIAEGRASPVDSIPVFGDELRLPLRLAGLEYEDLDVYPNRQLGVRIRYSNDWEVKADAYLYDLGLVSIPEDLQAPEVVEWFREAHANVIRHGQMGHYLDLQTRASQYLHIPRDAPEPLCLWAAYQYREEPDPQRRSQRSKVSHLALRTDRGYINKVRFTYPESVEKEGFASFLEFVQAWTNAVQMYQLGAPE